MAAACPRSSDQVLLIHGLGGSPWWMRSLDRRLTAAGYACRHFQYPSLSGRIAGHAEALADRLAQLDDELCGGEAPGPAGRRGPSAPRLHVVSHSLGGLILRQAVAEVVPRSLHRVVMLTPPNRGSHVATRLAPLLGWLLGPLHELKEGAAHGTFGLPLPPSVDVGVIASRSDAVVALESTILPGLADHVALPCRHVGVLFNEVAGEAAIHFLRHGRFRVATDCRTATGRPDPSWARRATA